MTTISLPMEFEEPFQDLARKTGRSLEELMREAMANYLEDMADADEANRFYQEFKGGREPGIPWEQVKAEMDLKHGL
ncbi:MAG: ribbon-helix-helix protein, CopG family [Magnetococcales bacterium]|nr:ribbon-helix-helix protein, CopG family [Magnetococcales bacterium]